jgi:hypothetical protein
MSIICSRAEIEGSIKAESALTKLKGKIEVTVNSHLELTFPGGFPKLDSIVDSGGITLKKGEVKIAIEEEEEEEED